MNPQYIQQQQQAQQPSYYSGPQGSAPYGELNSNLPPNILKGPPLGSQTYMSQKQMQGQLPGNPQPSQPPYFANSTQGQGNVQQEAPTNNPHMMPPPISQNNLVNQMTNMSLVNQQRPSSGLAYPPLPGKSSPIISAASNVNGFNNATDVTSPGTGSIGQVDTGGKIGPPMPEQDIKVQSTNQQSHSASQAGSLPFTGPPTRSTTHPPGQYHPGQNLSTPEHGFHGLTLPGQQRQPGQINVDSSSGQPNLPRPPSTGQRGAVVPPPPGQQNIPNMPPLGQQNLSNSPLPGQQNFNSSPMQGQADLTGRSVHGQDNLSGQMLQKQQGPPGLHSQPNLPGPPSQGQHTLSGPPLPSHPYPPSSSQQKPGQAYPELHNMVASSPYGPSNLSGPQLPSQQNAPSSMLTGQHSFNRPPLPGQQNLSGPPGHPHLLPGQTMEQSQMMSSSGSNLGQPGQRQFPPGPPLPGQRMSGPVGMSRASSGTMPGYQPQEFRGYTNQDMYGGQRSPYLSGPSSTTSGYQPDMQPQQTKRLDRELMPSPIQVMQDDQRAKGGVFITNQRGLVPPLVTTKFVTQDEGNASPRYIRSTFYTIPTTSDIIKLMNVPFALILNPMARIAEGEYEPPIVDMGEIGPVRCVRCKAYMSPFMQFIDAGRRFQCMFCKATTEVPAEYFQHLDHTGQRMDRYERPELMLGTYEYIATKDYCRNNTFPKPPAIVFVIDVSYNTIKSGLVNLLCMKMKSIIQNLPVDAGQTKTNMKVGFITYNNTVHFYNINPCLAQPQMMVVGDIQDVFMPLLDGFLCNIEESETVIDSLMTQIPAMFADTRETETILAPAIQAGLEALKASDCAGKLIVFHSSLPIAEAPGKLKNRDDRKVLGTEKEKTVLAPQTNAYNNLGQDCVGAGCSVDLFVFNNSYVDIATIGQISRLTGGEVYKYTYFQADVDGDRLIADLIENISRPIAFDAIMRVRTSTGVRPTDFYGHFFMSNTTDMELASIDCNKAVAIEVKHDDKLTDEEGVYIQAALLYTSCSGIRRLRIINLSLKTSSEMAELYRTCDLDAIINYISKQSVFKLIESTPKTVKDSLISRCASLLAAYRKHCALPSSNAQLILPEYIKLIPLYINCLLKSDALSGGADMSIDDRSYVMQAVATMPVSISVVYTYPRLLPLHDIDPEGTELPEMLRCSIDNFTDDGAYLLDNSIHMFLWIGLSISPQWVQAVFGVPSVVQIDTDRTTLPVLDTPLNKRITDIINEVRAARHRCMRLTIVRQREKLEMVLRHFLIEDRGNDGSPSYIDFLCHMHKEIRALLSQ
ncbi:hypothetical protein KM043_009019 [Ampulex compressa]|nr:hypothetical protein KM043_009019 [Ampulex compressa]